MYHTPPLVAICKLLNLDKAHTHFFGALVPRLTSEVRRGTCLPRTELCYWILEAHRNTYILNHTAGHLFISIMMMTVISGTANSKAQI